ncbi:MAG: hypothetical protein HYX50_04860 [Chloroflexi bacterium]|nr:hypothetical protein [Chloroflexota bacterium]
MRTWWHSLAERVRRIWRFIVLLVVLRLVVGIAAIVFFNREAVAWSPVLTALTVGALAVYVSVAFAVRWFSPAKRL